MTRATIGKLGQFCFIVGRPLPVAVQTPTHVHHLWVNGNPNIGDIAVTALAVQPRRNVRTVREMDKVRNLGYRHPRNFFIVCNEVS